MDPFSSDAPVLPGLSPDEVAAEQARRDRMEYRHGLALAMRRRYRADLIQALELPAARRVLQHVIEVHADVFGSTPSGEAGQRAIGAREVGLALRADLFAIDQSWPTRLEREFSEPPSELDE